MSPDLSLFHAMADIENNEAFAVKCALAVLHITAWLCSLTRYWNRRTRRQLWFDDHAALIAVISDIAYFWVLWKQFGHASYVEMSVGPIVSYWSSAFLMVSTLWLSRVSHCLSVVRVFRWGDIQWWGLLFALVFVTIGYLVSVVVFVTTCDWGTDWLDPLDEGCVKGDHGYTIASIFFSSADVLSETLVFGVTMLSLWQMKAPSNKTFRYIVLSSSSTNLLTLAAATALVVLSYSSYRYHTGVWHLHFTWTVVSNLEIVASLFTCNVMVLTARLYALLLKIGLLSWVATWFSRSHSSDTEMATSGSPPNRGVDFGYPMSSTPPSSADERAALSYLSMTSIYLTESSHLSDRGVDFGYPTSSEPSSSTNTRAASYASHLSISSIDLTDFSASASQHSSDHSSDYTTVLRSVDIDYIRDYIQEAGPNWYNTIPHRPRYS